MAKKHHDPERLRAELEGLIKNFKTELLKSDLRTKVLSLIPVFKNLCSLGTSLIPDTSISSARERILYYFRKYPKTILDGDELMVVAGISEYARRIRELRVQFGWSIASGNTIREMLQSEEMGNTGLEAMKPNQYVLLSEEQDRDAAHRWNLANTIRRGQGSVRDKILEFLRSNIGKEVTNEELRYVAGNSTEWARRVRELRTEFGWPIVTKTTGNPDLNIGVYVLQADRQAPAHDRNIKDDVRGEVLRRDGYKCTECGWSQKEWNPSDPRHLECHHVKAHAEGGKNTTENLITLCNICHDKVHRT